MYSINFTEHNTKFCLSVHYNGANSYSFVNGNNSIMSWNISKDVSVDNGYVSYFSVDYDAWCYCSWWNKIMFGFSKKCCFFFIPMTFFSFNVFNVTLLKCILMDDQECKIRPVIINVNSEEPSFFFFVGGEEGGVAAGTHSSFFV